MRKSIFTLAPAALVLLAVAGNTQAATNAQLTVTANVVAATCDVSLSSNSLDLGNFSPKQFTGVLTPIPASQKQFTVGLNNCEAPLPLPIPPTWLCPAKRWRPTQISSTPPAPIPASC